MTDRCGAVRPETRVVCDSTVPNHRHHTGSYRQGTRLVHCSWENEDYVAPTAERPTSRGHRETRMAELVGAVSEQDRASGRQVDPAVPSETVQAWNRDEWVEQTYTAFEAFLAAHSEPFTTAEDFWPTIDAPEQIDMRAMSLVVQQALRRNLLVEVGAKRLREIYRTRNGVQFPMNKLVPVYRRRLD